MVENAADIEKAMNWDVQISSPRIFQTSLFEAFTDEENKIINLLKEGDRFVDEITITTQLPMSRVSALLLGLEFRGLVISLPGKMYRLK